MNHVPLVLNPLNPAVRSSLIWQMLYLMGASNSFLSLSWLAPLQYLTQIVVKTHSHGPHIAHQQQGFIFIFRTLSLHDSRQRGPRAAVCAQHHLAGRGYRDEYWWYEMPAAKPLPWNLTPGMLHQLNQEYRSTILFYYGASSSDNTYLAPNPELGSLDEKKICEKKKLTGKNARGNREPGRQIAQFKLNGCTDRIQVGVGQIELAGFLL